MTFGKFAEVYRQRHVLAKGLALSSTIDYRLKPLVERFGDRPVAEIKTADIDDFVADLKEARRSIRRPKPRTNFQESFKIPPNRASLEAKTPPRNPLQVTEKSPDGELVPVRGFEPRSRG
jgi:hypothetical protein